MARSDLIIKLVQSANNGDKKMFAKAVEALIAEERDKQHHILADKLVEIINETRKIDKETTFSKSELVFELNPTLNLEQLFLDENIYQAIRELQEEHNRVNLLRAYNLEPRNRILLVGPPGNGKTSLAEAIATELMVPLFTARYDQIIGSYLGETASKLNDLFNYVRTRKCVLFFDEFDAIGKERGDVHETGEIKRVVSSLLLQIDNLPSHVIVVTSTNHPELLDKAVWRRFQLRLYLNKPTRKQIEEWFNKFIKEFEVPLGYSSRTLANNLYGLSFAEIEEFGLDIKRQYVLRMPVSDLKQIVKERLAQWKSRFSINREVGDLEDER